MKMKDLVKKLFEEKKDFYCYLEAAEMETDSEKKAMYLKLAESEGDHYKALHGIIFADENRSEREEGFYEVTKECYQEMVEEIKKHLSK